MEPTSHHRPPALGGPLGGTEAGMSVEPAPRPPRVLVIDDSAENRALAQAALEDEDFVVRTAASGAQGVADFEAHRPDCVLLDVRMPGEDGFATCQKLRALQGGADTPILFLTALRDLDTFDKAQSAGGDDFLTKPVRPTELVMRVRAALKLRRVSEELSEHYQLVRKQRDDLMRLALQREQLVSFVVHDLKNPLHSMDLLAQLLLKDGKLDGAGKESVELIRAEVRTLVRLVRNLLDVSRSDEGALSPRKSLVDLAVLGEEIVDALSMRATTYEVRLAKDVKAPTVVADEDLLRRVIENLVENAIRHAPKGTAVTLSAEAGPHVTELRVRDLGPGVPLEMRQKVFERFVQLEGGQPGGARRTGHGLGLAFCKLAVEAHGGTISIEDGAPGAVFCVRLPS